MIFWLSGSLENFLHTFYICCRYLKHSLGSGEHNALWFMIVRHIKPKIWCRKWLTRTFLTEIDLFFKNLPPPSRRGSFIHLKKPTQPPRLIAAPVAWYLAASRHIQNFLIEFFKYFINWMFSHFKRYQLQMMCEIKEFQKESFDYLN